MNEDVVSLSCVMNPETYSKHSIFALSAIRVLLKPRWFLTWAQPGICDICHYARSIMSTKQGAVAAEESSLNERCVWMWRMVKNWKMFPKHWETWAFNIEESSGSVYFPAARRWFQISSNNLTCHFMMWYFGKQGNCKLQILQTPTRQFRLGSQKECSVC